MDFIVHCYDIVEGPMANDTIFNYVEDFIEGRISRETFWELAKFKHPTHQICFNTENALKTLPISPFLKKADGTPFDVLSALTVPMLLLC